MPSKSSTAMDRRGGGGYPVERRPGADYAHRVAEPEFATTEEEWT